jgi:hypothetical protein
MGPEQGISRDIESPTHLEEGQNLLDQPPFKFRIAQAALKSGIPEDTIRYSLSTAARIPGADHVFADSEEMQAHRRDIYSQLYRSARMGSEMQNPIINQLRAVEQFRDEERGILSTKYARAISSLVTALEPYPLWADYLVYKSTGYNLNGEYTKQPTMFVPEPTYVAWLMDQQQARKGRKLWGIREIRPDAYSGTDPVEHARASGEKAANRYFRIVRHAETGRRQ